MRKLNWLFFTFLAFTFIACNDDDDSLDNQDPTITITSPVNGASYNVGDQLLIQGTVSDNVIVDHIVIEIDGAVAFDDLDVNINQQSQTLNQTVTIDQRFEQGGYTLRVIAVDGEGNEASSPAIGFTVNNDGGGTTESITVAGIEEGGTYNMLGGTEGNFVTYNFTGEEGIDSVNVNTRTSEGNLEIYNRGYNQAYFDEQGIDNSGDFSIEDEIMYPNVAAARGENTVTITTYRDGTQVGTRSYTTNLEPAEGAREVTFTARPSADLPEDSRMVIAGDFQTPVPYATNNALYELNRDEETGYYSNAFYTTGDMNYNYSLWDEEGTGEFVEVDENCQPVEQGYRSYMFADGDTDGDGMDTVEEDVNYAGYGDCVE